ncbi:MAG TPA: beta-ketoacyl-ACP reductase, partial [Achromobacter sp.]|nr:beta-ketoacyl-ACP reductase [Achromobacter sp.]
MTAKRTALITGGTGCLGRAIAVALHDAGHDVIVTYHSSENATREWIKEEAAKGRTFAMYKVNVADFDACQTLARKLEEDGRQIDILVNNAGITRDTTFHRMRADQWHDVINTNLNSVFNVTRPVIEGMRRRGWGRVIQISSING